MAKRSDKKVDVAPKKEMVAKSSEKTPVKSVGKTKLKSKNHKVIPNIIYIGHLPKDCEERELIGFLKQFGRLVQLRLCRSHRTGGSKGYAFAKFQTPAVAAIVAETLSGHLLFQKRLVSHVLSPEQIHGKIFSKNTRTVFQRKIALKSTTSPEEIAQRLLEREQKKREKLKSMGIDFDFPGYEASLGGKSTKPASKKVVKDDNVVVAEKKSAEKKSKDKEKTDKDETPKAKSAEKKNKSKEKADKDETPKTKTKSQRKRSLSGDEEGDKDTPKTKTKSQRKRSLSGDAEEDKSSSTPKSQRKRSLSGDAEDGKKKDTKKEEPERPQSEKKPKKSKKKEKKHSRKSVP